MLDNKWQMRLGGSEKTLFKNGIRNIFKNFELINKPHDEDRSVFPKDRTVFWTNGIGRSENELILEDRTDI